MIALDGLEVNPYADLVNVWTQEDTCGYVRTRKGTISPVEQLKPASLYCGCTAPEPSRAPEPTVVPTFRSPHLTLTFDDLEAGLSALAVAEHEIRHNPYHEH